MLVATRGSSVADPDLDSVGTDPFWSDPDNINFPDPNPTIKSHKNKKQDIRYIFFHLHFYKMQPTNS